jgi:hypothetical protein
VKDLRNPDENSVEYGSNDSIDPRLAKESKKRKPVTAVAALTMT